MKTCSKCKIVKHIDDFHKDKSSKDGHKYKCKECTKIGKYELNKLYRLNNKEILREKSIIYRENNVEKLKERSKNYYSKNKNIIKEKSKNYYSNNKEKKIEYQKKYQQNNKEKRNTYLANRRKNDPLFKLITNVRNLIYNTFYYNGYSKESKTYDLLGCTFEYFKEYLENNFEDWMNWDNRALYNGTLNYGWDIDHIIPLSSATNIDELIKLCHYTNLQPLCSYINRDIKKNNINYGII